MALHEIYTSQDLKNFRDLINSGLATESAILMRDINLNGDYNNQWIPIGNNSDNPFSGNFNGNGYTVRGIFINNNELEYVGFIGRYVRNDNTPPSTFNIKDLTVDGYIENNRSDNYIGGMIGYITGFGTNIYNCTNKININNNQGQAGGIVGMSSSIDNYKNCINEGNIIGIGDSHSQKSGGIIWKHNHDFIINDCINKGNITNGNGIVGVSPGISNNIINCINKGNITNGNGIISRVYTSEIIGCINEGNITNGNGICEEAYSDIQNCINKGNIIDGAGICDRLFAILLNCINEGNIINNTKTTISSMVNSFHGTNIVNCLNKGNITVSNNNSNVNFIGGIISGMYEGSMKNCVNMGDINYLGNRSVCIGGIISGMYEGSMKNCVNMGNIHINNNDEATGGIVGKLYNIILIQNCSNTGKLFSGNSVLHNKGAIVGDIHIFPIIESEISNINTYFVDNFYQVDSFNRSIGCRINFSEINPEDYLVITDFEDSFYSFTEGNSPAVASIIEISIRKTDINIIPTIYPYYNNNISIVTFSNWSNTNDNIANIENDMIIFKQMGDITVGYKANFELRDSIKILNDVIVTDKLLKNIIKVKLYKMKYLKHYNNYLFCLFRETKH